MYKGKGHILKKVSKNRNISIYTNSIFEYVRVYMCIYVYTLINKHKNVDSMYV